LRPATESISATSRTRRSSLIDSLNCGSSDSPGTRMYMEDAHKMVLKANVEEEPDRPTKRAKISLEASKELHSFFVVCDGHGGVQVADYVKQNLYQNIVEQSEFELDVEAAIRKGFSKTESALQLMEARQMIDGGVGTTVTIALVVGNILYVANLGDSEAVLCTGGKERVLTISHTPSNEDEKKRVQQEGGLIITTSRQKRLGHPSWNPNYVNIGVTRAMGDFYFKSPEWVGSKSSGLTADPSIATWKITTDDEFLLIASDGFWDVVTHREAVAFVRACTVFDNNFICRALVQLGESRNSRDNITVLLVKFAV